MVAFSQFPPKGASYDIEGNSSVVGHLLSKAKALDFIPSPAN